MTELNMGHSPIQISPRAKAAYKSAFEIAKARLRQWVKGTEVTTVRIGDGLRNAKHVVIVPIHNEISRLPYLLEYYRNMGFEHFIFIDNNSTDGAESFLISQPDVSIFRASGEYRNSRYGVDWINSVLSRFCDGKWILHVDSDELFVYPCCDQHKIQTLTDYLSSHAYRSMQCILVDMYSDKPSSDNICPPGGDPLKICPLYDRSGYQKHFDSISNTTWIKGGVRPRIFFEDARQWPALNKTPLVFWQRRYAFLKSAHQLWPPVLNGGNSGAPIFGALLHFKFLASFSKKVEEEAIKQQHTTEWQAYLRDRDSAEPSFIGPMTKQYRNWRSLIEDGLMTGEHWADK